MASNFSFSHLDQSPLHESLSDSDSTGSHQEDPSQPRLPSPVLTYPTALGTLEDTDYIMNSVYNLHHFYGPSRSGHDDREREYDHEPRPLQTDLTELTPLSSPYFQDPTSTVTYQGPSHFHTNTPTHTAPAAASIYAFAPPAMTTYATRADHLQNPYESLAPRPSPFPRLSHEHRPPPYMNHDPPPTYTQRSAATTMANSSDGTPTPRHLLNVIGTRAVTAISAGAQFVSLKLGNWGITSWLHNWLRRRGPEQQQQQQQQQQQATEGVHTSELIRRRPTTPGRLDFDGPHDYDSYLGGSDWELDEGLEPGPSPTRSARARTRRNLLCQIPCMVCLIVFFGAAGVGVTIATKMLGRVVSDLDG